MVIGDNTLVEKQGITEIEELRHELETLILKKESDFDEVLKISRKLDEVLSNYYKVQLAMKR